MAIDVQSEAERMMMSIRAHDYDAGASMVAEKHLQPLIARVRREQMEADCKAVCVSCREKWAVVPARMQADKSWGHECYEGMPDIPCKANAIRTAFAATEPKLSPNEVFRLAHEPDAPRAFMEIANQAHAEHERATEPRNIVKEHIEAAATLNAVGKEKTLEQLIKAAVELAKYDGCSTTGEATPKTWCECASCRIRKSARELGLDGDA